ncbi:hypothetical protein E4U32_002643 [Claviceps aff. humidiphila group G2b]|nr:hypothetical protein E4U32_002643 [Claviceps aff. humidiphila group G2b]
MGRKRPRLADAFIDLQNLSDTSLSDEFNQSKMHDEIEASMREEKEKSNCTATSSRNTRRHDLREERNRAATSSTYTPLSEFNLNEIHDRIEASMRKEKEKGNRAATSSRNTRRRYLREERNRAVTSSTYTPLSELNLSEIHDRIEASMRKEKEKSNRAATSSRNTRRRYLREERNRAATSSTYTPLPEFNLSEIHDRIEASMRKEKEKSNRTATSRRNTWRRRLREEIRRRSPTEGGL